MRAVCGDRYCVPTINAAPLLQYERSSVRTLLAHTFIRTQYSTLPLLLLMLVLTKRHRYRQISCVGFSNSTTSFFLFFLFFLFFCSLFCSSWHAVLSSFPWHTVYVQSL